MESTLQLQSFATDLACSQCGELYSLNAIQYFSTCCEKPLVVNYLQENTFNKSELQGRENSMWRYSEMLPLTDNSNKVSLGEGMTPILPMDRIAKKYGFANLFVKDEGQNPTGSFKSRGLSMAISKAKELGIIECVIPTAGNAGGAMSAYCAAAGMKATVIMPRHTPKPFQDECRFFGADLKLVDGLIDRCGEMAAEFQKETGAFNMSTLKEPYRLEGKKTMGYEIAEQLNWELPDVIVYPTGGGTGLIGIWKAFHEMIEMGWIDGSHLPRMIVVQSLNCAPMVHFVEGNNSGGHYGESKANGLAVPKAFGKDLIKNVVRESNGGAIAVSEESLLRNAKELSRAEGISFSPEGGATMAGLLDLVTLGAISREEKILLINTGNASKYMDHLQD
ncbi:MAG: threonine synthase [Cyclobacteriaceae bacterium]